MALNTSKCNHLTPLNFKGLSVRLNLDIVLVVFIYFDNKRKKMLIKFMFAAVA